MSSPVIELVDVSKRYESSSGCVVEALSGVSLTINQGEMVAITGRSGSGKSTLLHVMSGLTAPTEGQVHLVGKDISGMTDSQRASFRNRQMGFVFQSFFLEPALSAWENVALPLIVQKTSLADRKARAVEALERVGLNERIAHKPSELSGGEAQRVCIARSIISHPDLIFADEPTGNLDEHSSQNVMAILRKLADDGTTVVLVTHDPHDASICDRSIVIVDGCTA